MSVTVTAALQVLPLNITENFHFYRTPVLARTLVGASQHENLRAATFTGQIYGLSATVPEDQKKWYRFSLRRPDNTAIYGNDRYHIMLPYRSETTCLMLHQLNTSSPYNLYALEKSSVPTDKQGDAVFQVTYDSSNSTYSFYCESLDRFLGVKTIDSSAQRGIIGVLPNQIGYTTQFKIDHKLLGAVIAGAHTDLAQATPAHQYYIHKVLPTSPSPPSVCEYLSCTNVQSAALTQVATAGPNGLFAFYLVPDPAKAAAFTYYIRTSEPDSNGKYQFLCMNEADHPTIPDKKVYTIQLRDEDNLLEWEEWCFERITGTNRLGSFKLVCYNKDFDGNIQQQMLPENTTAGVIGEALVENPSADLYISRAFLPVTSEAVVTQKILQAVEEAVNEAKSKIDVYFAAKKEEFSKLAKTGAADEEGAQ